MKLDILEQTDMPLLSRKRVTFEVSFDEKTPSKVELSKLISAKMKVKEDVIKIKGIDQYFGDKKASVIAHIYNKPEDINLYEKLSKKQKGITKEGKPKQDNKQEAKPKEEKKEAPKEVVKEDKKEEVKEEKKEEVKQDGKKKETKEQSS